MESGKLKRHLDDGEEDDGVDIMEAEDDNEIDQILGGDEDEEEDDEEMEDQSFEASSVKNAPVAGGARAKLKGRQASDDEDDDSEKDVFEEVNEFQES